MIPRGKVYELLVYEEVALFLHGHRASYVPDSSIAEDPLHVVFSISFYVTLFSHSCFFPAPSIPPPRPSITSLLPRSISQSYH